MVGSRKATNQPVGRAEKVYLTLLLIIFGGIVLHAPLSVGLGTLFPDYSLLIKSWKEILIIIASVLSFIIIRRKQRTAILKEPLMIGVAIYAAIHILVIAIFARSVTPESLFAGLAIDLRYILFFVLVYVAILLYPAYRSSFIKVGIAGAAVVVVFALLQVFVLPPDFLKYIGYNLNTIAPYLTVDQNHDFIRINSTLRGPNPLGAYAGIVLSLLASFWLRSRSKLKHPTVIAIVLGLGGLVALWASYSRSALIGTVIAIGVILAVTVLRRLSKRMWIVGTVVVLALFGGLFVARGSEFVSNVILHDNPTTGSVDTSNEGHLLSLQDGISRLATQPFGAGVGSTGSASLFGGSPVVIENQYLFVAHEVGWLGLVVFLLIFIGILNRLWQRRSDWLALGVFAIGIGLAVIGLLLPVWADDTVAIVWWGLAAIAIGSRGRHE